MAVQSFTICKRILMAGITLGLLLGLVARAPVLKAAGVSPDVETLPVLWEAGGISAGSAGAGQAARFAVDPFGNLAIVSAPAFGADLAVTSYTSAGDFRWQSTISPSSGTFLADWVAAAPNGDVVAVGRNISGSSGNPISISLVRFSSSGDNLWRVDLATILPAVGRLLLDSAGDAYLAFNALGDGQDINLHKYDTLGNLVWSKTISTGLLSNNIATSLALSPGETEIALVGDTLGGAEWITALYDTTTGDRKWLVVAPEGVAALDVVVDADRVFVTGQGNDGIEQFLTVIAYDRTSGSRQWRTDRQAGGSNSAAGLRIAMTPAGNLVVAGQAVFGFLEWYIVALDPDGNFLWDAVRDGGLNTDEVPKGLVVLADGTAVVTGPGGPPLPGGYIRGVTAGFDADGTLIWEGFSRLATTWTAALPNGEVCSVGGYDALVTCWRTLEWRIWLPIVQHGP